MTPIVGGAVNRSKQDSRRISHARSPWIAALTLLSLSFIASPALLCQNTGKTKRKVVVSVAPDYPYVLRNGHFEGQVRLEATVLPNGAVSKVDIMGGNPMLSRYAAEAVMRWKYVPAATQTVEQVVFTFNSNSK
jgi:TonB family protein